MSLKEDKIKLKIKTQKWPFIFCRVYNKLKMLLLPSENNLFGLSWFYEIVFYWIIINMTPLTFKQYLLLPMLHCNLQGCDEAAQEVFVECPLTCLPFEQILPLLSICHHLEKRYFFYGRLPTLNHVNMQLLE